MEYMLFYDEYLKMSKHFKIMELLEKIMDIEDDNVQ